MTESSTLAFLGEPAEWYERRAVLPTEFSRYAAFRVFASATATNMGDDSSITRVTSSGSSSDLNSATRVRRSVR